VREIALSGKKAAGRVALVDDEDYEVVSQHRWHAQESTRKGGRIDGPYAATRIPRKGGRQGILLMHKLITGYLKTDHRNGNGLDNQRKNLRPATNAQNTHNQRPRVGTSSPYKGVCWNKASRKWQAAIKVAGSSRHLGLFATEEEAARAYEAAALAIQGDYAFAARPKPSEEAA
jgi:hypothetical protein